MPTVDAGRISRLRDVLAGGHLALEPDRRLAASILERWPATASLVRAANEFHRRAAQWAVTGGTSDFPIPPAAGVIFAASGYPLPGGFHATAAAARPDALFAYAEVDQPAISFSRALLAARDPERVSVYAASARNPDGLLAAAQARAILGRGPVMVQLQLCAQWWPAEFAAWAVAEYARLLPSGRVMALRLAAHLEQWPSETLLTGLDGGQLSTWALERAVRAARAKVRKCAECGEVQVKAGPAFKCNACRETDEAPAFPPGSVTTT
jgi:hypothetical protein